MPVAFQVHLHDRLALGQAFDQVVEMANKVHHLVLATDLFDHWFHKAP